MLNATGYNLQSLDVRMQFLEAEVAEALGATDYFGNGDLSNGKFRTLKQRNRVRNLHFIR